MPKECEVEMFMSAQKMICFFNKHSTSSITATGGKDLYAQRDTVQSMCDETSLILLHNLIEIMNTSNGKVKIYSIQISELE